MGHKILITGANGQLGTVLKEKLNQIHGISNVIISDISSNVNSKNKYVHLDILDKSRITTVIKEFEITEIYHLAAVLSAKAEDDPLLSWNINFNGTINIIDTISRINKPIKLFLPSSIAVFGSTSPKYETPQESSLIPTSNYGIAKVSAELWANYYFNKYKIDIRGLRFPGIISYQSPPGGGTTDYAIEMLIAAVQNQHYTCFLSQDTLLPMMYIDDAIEGIVQLMESNFEDIKIRTAYNMAAISFTPKELYLSIKKYYPAFSVSYEPDFRQKIADSWSSSIDDNEARNNWGWHHSYDLDRITKVMIKNLKIKYRNERIKYSA